MTEIQNISDTARWVAVYRARETERPHPLFRDPFARRLAGERGEAIVAAMKKQDRNEWAFIIRTYLFDAFLRQEIAAGADMVINLAAGLDARPYRMELPPSLQWIEVDLPELLAYKEDVLRGEMPRCALERVALDLADVPARRQLFARLGAKAKRAVVMTEGLLVYLSADEVRQLADDLAAQSSFQRWIAEIASPGLLKLLQKQVGKKLEEAHAPLKFAPPEGVEFFEPSGWKALEVRGSLKSASKVLKLPWLLRFFAMFPEKPKPGNQPWSGICLLGRAGAGTARSV